MWHLLEVAEYRARAGAPGAAAVRAVAHEVDRAVGLLDEATGDAVAAVVHAGHEGHLVDLGAQLGRVGIDRSLQRAQRTQAIHMPFAEEVAAFDDLLDQLLEGDGFPFAGVSRTDAFHRAQYAKWRIDLADHRVAPPAGGGATVEAFVAEARKGDEAFAHRYALRQFGVCGQRVVGVAGDAQHLAGALVDSHPHAALGGAAEAPGVAHLLVRVERQFAGERIDLEFGCRRVTVEAARWSILAQHLVPHAIGGLRKTGGKGGEAAGGNDLATYVFHGGSPQVIWLSRASPQGNRLVNAMNTNTHRPAVPNRPSQPSWPRGKW